MSCLPREALAFSKTMIAERRVLPLEGGLMTTLKVRAQEQAIERRFTQLAIPADREVGEAARAIASDQVAERISGRLSDEQAHALQVITGPERGAILVGPAGTGKGVVLDAAARAEQLTGHQTFGVAVSWSTAERLGRDSPALAESTFSIDALIARVQHGQLTVDQDTTIYLDEAGMADTARLDRLTEIVERTGAKLVAIGDSAQLPSIGAGGMFDRLAEIAPSAQLSNIRRTLDPAEQQAWADLRAGRSDKAMAHYHARGQLHMADTRDNAVEHAVQDWAKLTETHPIEEVALISDASNQEIHRLNARAQHLRAQREELGDLEVPVPGVHYGVRQGDRVVMIEQHREHGQERIENGSRGEVLDITPDGDVLIEFDITGRQANTHRRRPRPCTTRVRATHPPCARRDRHPHPRRHRRLANQQGARLRRGLPRPPRHPLVRLPRRPRNRRTRHRPHPTTRRKHGPQPRTDPIARAPRAGRPRLRARLSPHDRAQPHQPSTGHRARHQPHRPTTDTGANTMSQRLQIVLPDPVALQLHELAAGADTPPSTLAGQMVRNDVALAAKDGKVRPLRPAPVLVGGKGSNRAPWLEPYGGDTDWRQQMWGEIVALHGRYPVQLERAQGPLVD